MENEPKEETTADVVDIFSKKKIKKAETVLQDLNMIAHVLELTYNALYNYKHYTSAAEVMFVVNENMRVISAHAKKYQDMLDKKD